MRVPFNLLLLMCITMLAESQVTGLPDSSWMKVYQQAGSSPYTFLSAATEESLYVQLIESNMPAEYLNFLAFYPESYFAVLTAARYLLLELQNGGQLSILINNMNEIGFPAQLVSLQPLIGGKFWQIKKAVIFSDHSLRMKLRENYSGQLKQDPQLEWFLDYDKFVDIPFDALHLAARKNYFRVQGEHIQYLIADSLGLQKVLKVFNRVNLIMDDLSKKIGYTSTGDLFARILDRQYLIMGKMTVFVFNAREFQDRYLLKKAGWSYPLNGQIFIDPYLYDDQEFLEQLVHQISHIFIAGNIRDIHHSACRWFDEGFAQWAGRCYTRYQTLLPSENSFQQTSIAEEIEDLQQAAHEIWSSRNRKKIEFKSLNKQLTNYNKRELQEQAEKLSVSLIAYLVETFGSEKLLQVASRVSRLGQNYSERSLYYTLGWDYSDIQKGWNEWLSRGNSRSASLEKPAGESE